MSKAFAIIQNGNDLRDDPEQRDAFQSIRGILGNPARKFLNEKLRRVDNLALVGETLRPGAQ